KRRRLQRELGSGPDMGLRQHDGHGNRLLGQCGHAASVLRVCRPAGQRQLGGPSATRSANGILNSDWFGIGGGDGFQTAVDPTDYNIVYTESQDGNTNRYDLRGT